MEREQRGESLHQRVGTLGSLCLYERVREVCVRVNVCVHAHVSKGDTFKEGWYVYTLVAGVCESM